MTTKTAVVYPRQDTRLARMIREGRERLDMTVTEFAAYVGKSPAFISRLEGGTVPLTNPPTVKQIADAIGVSPDALYAAQGYIPRDIRRRIEALDADGLARLRAWLEQGARS